MTAWTNKTEQERVALVGKMLVRYKGNVTHTARALAIHRTQLSQFVSKHAGELGLVCPHCKSRLKVPLEAA